MPNAIDPQLYVERHGRRGGHTVVLIHGFSDNSATWNKVVPTLARRFRVLVVDLPGFGRSTGQWPRPLITGYVESLRRLIAAEPAREVTVVGNSLGAATALALATAHPELIDRVVLCDMPGIDTVPRTWRVAASRPSELLLRSLARPVPARALQQALGIGYSFAGMRHPLQPGFGVMRTGFDVHYAEKARVLGLLPLARQIFVDLSGLPIRRMIRELDMPVMLLWGQHDLLTPSRKARSFFDGPNRRVVVIPDCGHCPQLDRPAEFLAAIMPFVQKPLRAAS